GLAGARPLVALGSCSSVGFPSRGRFAGPPAPPAAEPRPPLRPQPFWVVKSVQPATPPSEAGLGAAYVAFGLVRPGVGSKGSHPYPVNHTSTQAWVFWPVT